MLVSNAGDVGRAVRADRLLKHICQAAAGGVSDALQTLPPAKEISLNYGRSGDLQQ
jgi:hypothetical protein